MVKLWLTNRSSSSASFCRGSTVGIIWREKKRYFPGRVGNIPVKVGKNQEKKPGQLYWAL